MMTVKQVQEALKDIEPNKCRICSNHHPVWIRHEGHQYGICKNCYKDAVREYKPELGEFEDFLSAKEVTSRLADDGSDNHTMTIRVKKGAGKTGNTKFLAEYENGEITEWEACGTNDDDGDN
jgi:hypothetical protein